MSLGIVAQRFLTDKLKGIAGITQATSTPVTETSQADWRVKLSLGSGVGDFYTGVLKPLSETGGVIFPYTPQIQVSYVSTYESTEPTHSNYKIHQYKNSAVEQVTITATFTAQDVSEANYMLAVIHFFKTVTKMFYGQDENPKNGTPPPVCYINGFGTFQFNNHPLVISNFSYNLPEKVDYIRAYVPPGGESNTNGAPSSDNPTTIQRLARLGLELLPGGRPPPTKFVSPKPGQFSDVTYVPTEIQMTVMAYPVISRKRISEEFSLRKYASGELTKKGIW